MELPLLCTGDAIPHAEKGHNSLSEPKTCYLLVFNPQICPDAYDFELWVWEHTGTVLLEDPEVKYSASLDATNTKRKEKIYKVVTDICYACKLYLLQPHIQRILVCRV